MVNSSTQTAESRWRELDTLRQSHLDTMRQCAMLTLPYVLPPEGFSRHQQLPRPYQGMGSKCVNNLTSKLQLSLFSPNQPYFKFEVDESLINTLEQQDSTIRDQVLKTMNEQEKMVQSNLERSGYRPVLFQVLKYAVVSGNYLLHQPDEGSPTVYRLDQYVVVRDASGVPTEIILRDQIHISQIPEDMVEDDQNLLDQLESIKTDQSAPHGSLQDQKEEHQFIYTWIKLDKEKYRHHQELQDGRNLPKRFSGWSPKDAPEYLAGRLIGIAGEDYGRSIVEEYLGDFISLEGTERALVKGTACLAKLIYLVDPAGMTNVRRVANAQTGDFVSGRASDITPLSTEKRADFQMAHQLVERLERRLSHAFLLTTGVQRDAERVTAEEIRLLSAEIEDSLGGIYSMLSAELQMPILMRQMSILTKQNKLPKLKDDDVRPKIVAGIDGLGRGQDLKKMNLFMQSVQQIAQADPNSLAQLDFTGMVRLMANYLGLDTDPIFKSPQALQQEQQQKQQQVQQQQMQGAVMDGLGKSIPKLAGNPEIMNQVSEAMSGQTG